MILLVSNSIFLVKSTVDSKLKRWSLYSEQSKPGYMVVMFPNPNCDFSSIRIDECMAVELTDNLMIAVKRLGYHLLEMQVYFRGRKLEDITNHKGKVYGIDCQGRVCSLDLYTLKMTSVSENPLCEGTGTDNKKWLAVSDDELYLVHSCCSKGSEAFKVLRLNEEEGKWDELDGIGDDRILFVTFDNCFFTSKSNFPRWRGNCIVSLKGTFPTYAGGMISNASFEMESDCISVFHFEGGDCVPFNSYLGYFDILWPPLTWVWKEKCDIEEEDYYDFDDSDEDEDEEVEEVEAGTQEGNEQPSAEEEGNEEEGEETRKEQQQEETPENQVLCCQGHSNCSRKHSS